MNNLLIAWRLIDLNNFPERNKKQNELKNKILEDETQGNFKYYNRKWNIYFFKKGSLEDKCLIMFK